MSNEARSVLLTGASGYVGGRLLPLQAQPIAIEDLLQYLVEGLDWNGTESRIYEIGGPDQVSYGEIRAEQEGQGKS